MENNQNQGFELLKAIVKSFGKDVFVVQTGQSTYEISSKRFPNSRPTKVQTRENSVRIDVDDGIMIGYAASLASHYSALGMTPRVFYEGSLVQLCQAETAGIETMLALEQERKKGVVNI